MHQQWDSRPFPVASLSPSRPQFRHYPRHHLCPCPVFVSVSITISFPVTICVLVPSSSPSRPRLHPVPSPSLSRLCLPPLLPLPFTIPVRSPSRPRPHRPPALPDPVEDGGVAEDDGDAGQQEAEDEEELLGRLAVLLEDGAGEGGAVQAQGAPHLGDRGQGGGDGGEGDSIEDADDGDQY